MRYLSLAVLAALIASCSDTTDPVASSPGDPGGSSAPVAEASGMTAPDQTDMMDSATADDDMASDDMASDDMADDDMAVRSADAHDHGAASLALVLEGSRLTAELETPLYNLLGFEYAPTSDEETAKVREAEARLANPAQLFAINPEADCAATQPTALNLFETEDSHDGDHHGDDHRDEDHASDHDSDHGSGHDHDAQHRDALVTYTFECGSVPDLRTVSVEMLRLFPLMDDLDVVYLGADRQTSFELSPSDTLIDLRP